MTSPNRSSTGGSRPRSTSRAAAVACALVLALAACGGSDSGGPAPGNAAAAPAPAVDISGVMKPVTSFTLPTAPLDTGSLTGKVVYYIPILLATPSFKVTSDALAAALATVGMTLQICDGAANPTSISACINQAAGAGAAGIVMDAVDFGFVANAATAAQARGVPILITNQRVSPDHPAGPDLGYITGPAPRMVEAVARWIIKDSGGKAVVVANKVTNTPSSIATMDAGLKVFADECPGCTVTVNPIAAATYQLIAPSTSAAILKTPGVTHVLAEFDAFLQPTYAGVQQTGRASSIKLVATAADVSSVRAMKAGRPPAADVAQALAYQGWADADAVMRLALKQKLGQYNIPYRLVDATNVGELDLSDAGVDSGSWFGPTDFTDRYKKLWGVS